MIEAQPFSGRIWAYCADTGQLATLLGGDRELDNFPRLKVEEWRPYLASLDEDDAASISDVLLDLIRLECARADCEAYIPDELSDVFGPDEISRRRLHFRDRLQRNFGWSLAQASVFWQMYVFEKLDIALSLPNTTLTQRKQEFDSALASIERFAGDVESEFQPAFQLAISLSKHADIEKSVDGLRIKHLLPALQGTWADSVQDLIDVFVDFGWSPNRVLGLAAISAADVFGAMGSWNDQSFEGEIGVQFELRSARLFTAMNEYFASLLTIEL